MASQPIIAASPKDLVQDPTSTEIQTAPSVLVAEGSGPENPGFSPIIGRLPVELEVVIPVREFRVRGLLALEKGSVIETQWSHGEDLPLSAGAVQVAWSEFEVIETKLAVRLTRLA